MTNGSLQFSEIRIVDICVKVIEVDVDKKTNNDRNTLLQNLWIWNLHEVSIKYPFHAGDKTFQICIYFLWTRTENNHIICAIESGVVAY